METLKTGVPYQLRGFISPERDIDAYLAAALVSDGQRLSAGITSRRDLMKFFNIQNFSRSSRYQAVNDYMNFVRENERDLVVLRNHHQYVGEQVAQDFWLSRNRLGDGFWDRGLGKRGDRLSDRAEDFGKLEVVVGSSGRFGFRPRS